MVAMALSWFGAVVGAVRSIPNTPYGGPSLAEYESALFEQIDGQKVTPYPNSTSYEW